MPTFDYICDRCGDCKTDEFVKRTNDVMVCSNCNNNMRRLFPSRTTVHTFPAEGIFLEHVSAEGKTFYSKSEMKRYARDNNLELGALL